MSGVVAGCFVVLLAHPHVACGLALFLGGLVVLVRSGVVAHSSLVFSMLVPVVTVAPVIVFAGAFLGNWLDVRP